MRELQSKMLRGGKLDLLLEVAQRLVEVELDQQLRHLLVLGTQGLLRHDSHCIVIIIRCGRISQTNSSLIHILTSFLTSAA